MHTLAEREKHQKQIGEKYMQNQHKRMPRIGDLHRQVGPEMQQAGEISTIVLHIQLAVFIPSSGPIHLAAENNDEK